MELAGTTCVFMCPVFSHLQEAVSREKGTISVEARTNVELDQVGLGACDHHAFPLDIFVCEIPCLTVFVLG